MTESVCKEFSCLYLFNFESVFHDVVYAKSLIGARNQFRDLVLAEFQLKGIPFVDFDLSRVYISVVQPTKIKIKGAFYGQN